MFARVQVEHELFERALEAGQPRLQNHETGAGHLRRGVEIHEAEPLADLEVLFGLKPLWKVWNAAVPANLNIVALVLAVRRVGERQGGNGGEVHIERRSGLPL